MQCRKLPKLTRIMYSSQKKWTNKNWDTSLLEHRSEIEKMLKKVNIFDIWSNALQEIKPAKMLIPEIFMDSYMSIHFACIALNKYSYVCLRSQLETGLRLIYFSTHPVEFKWWLEEEEWFKKKDVWGEGYSYFSNLENIKIFDKKCSDSDKLFVRKGKVSDRYSYLSKYVHSGAKKFQTTPQSFSPTYKIVEFKKWINKFTEIQEYINIILVLNFLKKFKELPSTEQTNILEIGIYKKKYREIIKTII